MSGLKDIIAKFGEKAFSTAAVGPETTKDVTAPVVVNTAVNLENMGASKENVQASLLKAGTNPQFANKAENIAVENMMNSELVQQNANRAVEVATKLSPEKSMLDLAASFAFKGATSERVDPSRVGQFSPSQGSSVDKNMEKMLDKINPETVLS